MSPQDDRSSAPNPASLATDIATGTGLKPGDVIYSVNGSPVSTVAALKSKIDQFKIGQEVVMQIERSGRLMYVTNRGRLMHDVGRRSHEGEGSVSVGFSTLSKRAWSTAISSPPT